ncbi:hypothetical protein CERSUDRAFT_71085 [Gelatoporia subvermispora B]|uniref:C2H2-type domain-containing protein n=1 Tax=Ceriporiopsis subvermispora (strain B) TaxID=914234 RepID=M2RQT5_CERS8|nr:hypothetical protein CERSUDRAFT_71085 [Gelatoporia subvermispora B]
MKRSYDYSFVSDSLRDTTIRHAHSLQQPIATPATQPPVGNYTALPQSLYYTPTSTQQAILPTLEFRVPLLATAVGFSSEFQSNTSLVQPCVQLGDAWNYTTSQAHISRSRLTGLGIRYDGPLAMNAPLEPTVVTSLPPAEVALRSTSLEPEGLGEGELSLKDICYVESSPEPKAHGSDNILDTEGLHNNASTSASTDCAYSECPALEYTAHFPSASFSLSSLSFGSSSESTSVEDLFVSVKKPRLDALSKISLSPMNSVDNLSDISNPLVGLFVDINMRELKANEEPCAIGVNPLDIMGDVYLKVEGIDTPTPNDCTELPPGLSLAPVLLEKSTDDASATEFPEEAISAIVSVLSASASRQDQPEHATATLPNRAAYGPSSMAQSRESLVIPVLPLQSALPSRSALYMNTSSVSDLKNPALGSHLGMSLINSDMHHASLPVQLQLQCPLPAPLKISQQQSPILNAHLGIRLEDLRERAEEFRRRNPGVELDKTWLQAYAGRLSERGELLDDYRCYVVGCAQRNKRRDHILVHVGAHVEHRPFQCGCCGMRFLRKNECKRHESSHAGHKPFSCPICAQSYQDRSFVRQDLLKRHMRVTHGVQSDLGGRRRRTTKEGGYWP